MIKLIDHNKSGLKEVFISKDMIHSMERMDDMTNIIMVGGCRYTVKETPEEIIAVTDIEQSNKVIDWEQRRYEIAKEVMALHCMDGANFSLIISASDAIVVADALITELKKGADK